MQSVYTFVTDRVASISLSSACAYKNVYNNIVRYTADEKTDLFFSIVLVARTHTHCVIILHYTDLFSVIIIIYNTTYMVVLCFKPPTTAENTYDTE